MRIEKPIRILLEDGAYMPVRAHRTDAGLDLFSREDVLLWGGMSHLFDTGVHIELPSGMYAEIANRSGLNVNHGIICPTGIIDNGYTGSIGVKLYNLTGESYQFHAGDRIAQLIIKPYVTSNGFQIVEELRRTDRGAAGFGSTGK